MISSETEMIVRRSPLKRQFVFVIAAAFGTGLSATGQEVSQGRVEMAADAVYQSTLREIAKSADRSVREQQIDRLLSLSERDRPKLVSQLLMFAARDLKDSSSRVVVGQVLKRLDIPKHVLVTALVPHLDNRDPAVRRVASELLTGLEDRSVERPPDFSAYRAIIEADVLAGRQPQASLVNFMYRSDPGTALITMMRAYQLRDPEEIKRIRGAEHVVSELLWKRRYGFVDSKAVDAGAIQELDNLSRSGHWWARLYVAQIIAQHHEFTKPELVTRLAADENVLVRELAQTPRVNDKETAVEKK